MVDSNKSQRTRFDLVDFYQSGKVKRIAKMAFVTVVLINLLSLGCLLTFGTTGEDWLTEYNLALYWTIATLTTVGYGDITPSDNVGRLYTMAVMLAGVGFYGFVIGQLAQFFFAQDRRLEHQKEKLEQLAGLFRHYDIPKPLQEQTFQFFQHVLERSSIEEEEAIIKTLPNTLQAELRIHMNIKPLANVSLFHGCSEACLRDAAQQLEQMYFSPKQTVFSKGDRGTDMYLIGWGKVIVHDGNNLIAELSSGNCFGEMALITEDVRGASVTATTYCDLYRLSCENFAALRSRHRDLAENVARLVEQRKSA